MRAFVRVMVMCAMNEPTPSNISCICYLAKIDLLYPYVLLVFLTERFVDLLVG